MYSTKKCIKILKNQVGIRENFNLESYVTYLGIIRRKKIMKSKWRNENKMKNIIQYLSQIFI